MSSSASGVNTPPDAIGNRLNRGSVEAPFNPYKDLPSLLIATAVVASGLWEPWPLLSEELSHHRSQSNLGRAMSAASRSARRQSYRLSYLGNDRGNGNRIAEI